MAFARKLHPHGARGSVRVWFYSVDRLSNAPSKVSCNTVLPNGNTVGQYINQGRAQLQAVVDAQNELAAAGGDVNPFAVQSAFASFVRDYGPIDFKNGAAGQGGNGALLGQAGNFAYYAIGRIRGRGG
jgi:hypothetical protein